MLDTPDAFVDIECERFHVIPLSFADHPVIVFLTQAGLFGIEDDQNVLFLPINPSQSYMLGTSYYTDKPMESYVDPIGKLLTQFGSSDVMAKCNAGDKAVIDVVLANVCRIQSALKTGVETRQCHPDYPYTDEHLQKDKASWNNLTKQ